MPAAIAGSFGYLTQNAVQVAAAALAGVGGMVGALVGSRLLRRLPIAWLRWLFLARLVAIALRTLVVIPTRGAEILSPDGRTKVGTIQRSKGLESGQVLLPWTRSQLLLAGAAGGRHTPESMLEREERDRRVLYVGMTRARDGCGSDP